MRGPGAIASAANIGAGGGGGGYVAKAVHLDGVATLACAALTTAPDNGAYSYAFWVKFTSVHQPSVFYVGPPPSGEWGEDFYAGPSPGTPGYVSGFYSEDYESYAEIASDNSVPVITNSWALICLAADYSLSFDDAILLINGQDFGQNTSTSGTYGVPFLPPINGKSFQIGGTLRDIFVGDAANFMFWAGKKIDWTDSANMAKVINGGKPVDPALAVAAFGVPTVLLSGDATSFGINQGSGGAFTVTGGSLTNASTSPSD